MHRLLRQAGTSLIVLQFTVENVAWAMSGWGDISVPFYFGILFALGAIMLLTSPLLSLSTPWLLGVTGLMEFGYLFAMKTGHDFASVAEIPSILKILVYPGSDSWVNVYFTVVPWIGFATAGMAAGKLLLWNRTAFFRWLPVVGVGLIAAFVPLRLFGGTLVNFIDVPVSGVMSLFYVTKYPPSVSYQLYTLGIFLLLFSLIEVLVINEVWLRSLKPLKILGGSALFFYVVHLYVYALMGLPFFPVGVGLVPVYLGCLLGIILIVPLCGRFSQFKRAQHPDSLWRML